MHGELAAVTWQRVQADKIDMSIVDRWQATDGTSALLRLSDSYSCEFEFMCRLVECQAKFSALVPHGWWPTFKSDFFFLIWGKITFKVLF